MGQDPESPNRHDWPALARQANCPDELAVERQSRRGRAGRPDRNRRSRGENTQRLQTAPQPRVQIGRDRLEGVPARSGSSGIRLGAGGFRDLSHALSEPTLRSPRHSRKLKSAARPPNRSRASTPDRRQAAALVFRISNESGLEVLLLTSRGTGRAVLPKGWLAPGEEGYEAAAREAYEEAGIRGRIDRHPIGTYEYWKKRTRHDELLHVEVYPLEVKHQRKRWPEQASRKLGWLSRTEAAKLVDEPALAALIRDFAPAITGRTK